jgi:hypothetical protein
MNEGFACRSKYQQNVVRDFGSMLMTIRHFFCRWWACDCLIHETGETPAARLTVSTVFSAFFNFLIGYVWPSLFGQGHDYKKKPPPHHVIDGNSPHR